MEGTNWEEEDGTKVMIDPIAPRQPPPPSQELNSSKFFKPFHFLLSIFIIIIILN